MSQASLGAYFESPSRRRARTGPGLGESDIARVVRDGRAVLLDVAPREILATLTRLGSLRFIVGNSVARAQHTSPVEGTMSDAGGTTIDLGHQAQLWAFPARWSAAVAVVEPLTAPTRLSLRFFDPRGRTVLEVHNGLGGDAVGRMRRCLEGWCRTPVRRAAAGAASARVQDPLAASPALALALAGVRAHGQTEALHALCARFDLSRLQALTMLGPPWGRQLSRPALSARLTDIWSRRLSVRLMVGNAGAKYLKAGPLASVRERGGRILVRDTGSSIELNPQGIAQSWAVQLRSGDVTVSSLEAFDDAGAPALSLTGQPGDDGREWPAWRALVEQQT